MPKKTLLEKTLALLKKDPRRTWELAKVADVGYFWLRKLRNGEIPDPGIVKIEKLYAILSK